jgi:hypothetical protein
MISLGWKGRDAPLVISQQAGGGRTGRACLLRPSLVAVLDIIASRPFQINGMLMSS